MTTTQQHPLADGTSVAISRDGRHQYWVGEKGPKMRGVTGLLGHVDSDSFGAGMGWGLKIAREHGGDLDTALNAPRQATKEAQDVGTQLHEAIDSFISNGTVDENPLFLAWHAAHRDTDWLGSERLIVHPEMQYGGTADALSLDGQGNVVLHDWKTVEPKSWHRHGNSLRKFKDFAQVSAYAHALEGLSSIWVPTKGYITYVLRDGSEAVVVEADLTLGLQLFRASRELALLIKQSANGATKDG